MLETNKLLPHDIAAEEAVIGSLLIDGQGINSVSGLIAPDDFYRERNRQVYEAALAVFSRGEAINQVTVAHELDAKELLENIGGMAYLTQTAAEIPTSVHIAHYAQIVKRTSLMRRLIDAAQQIADIGYANDADVTDSLGRAEEALAKVRQGHELHDFLHIKDSLGSMLKEGDESPEEHDKKPLRSGFSSMDHLLGGLHRSDMIVVAARPSVGKSMLGLNMAVSVALDGYTVAVFSLEMGVEQVAARLLANRSNIEMQRLRNTHSLSDNEEARKVDSIGLLSSAEIYIDDTPIQTVVEMRNKARRLQMERGLDFVVVDYMQLIDGGRGRRDANRVQEVSEISRQIKGMARDMNVPVLAISQLSRAIEHRQSHRPVLSDLRESGSIEQDADIVMFIHRVDRTMSEKEWNKTNEGAPYPRGLAELIVAKHRHGPIGSIYLAVKDEIGKFSSVPEARAAELRQAAHA